MKVLSHIGRAVGMLTLAVTTLAAEMQPTFHLKRGVYVTGSETCKNTPNAGYMKWNGRSFSGAHSSQCFTTQIGKGSKPYSLVTRCDSEGDGTPAPLFEESEQLTVLSPTSFHFAKLNAQGKITFEEDYHWRCGKVR